MIKVLIGERCEFETCMTEDSVLEESREILEFDSSLGVVAIINEYGDVYVVDVCLVPLEDARPDVGAYVEALLEEIEEEAI